MRAYIFDIGTWVDGDDVAVLHPQVVSDDAVQANASIIELVIAENDKNSVLALFAPNKNGIATEQLESVHGVV